MVYNEKHQISKVNIKANEGQEIHELYGFLAFCVIELAAVFFLAQ
ncbi:hypothetical protein Ga0466249_004437 [Sporomusaceae bacterium BoRhaA]|nr:hypothetical protein [Pelorhabdus rhamnosifermentans]